MNSGKIIIISGPSGSGKTTLYKKLLSSRDFKGKLVKVVSVTTRQKREGERNGRDYYFISKKMFMYKKTAGHFLESQKVFDNYYGTPSKQVREYLKAGKSVLLCIDVKGARVISNKCPQAIKIFIKTGSLAELNARLTQRGSENKKTLLLRMATAKKELKEAKYYQYVIINDKLQRAYREIKKVLNQELRK